MNLERSPAAYGSMELAFDDDADPLIALRSSRTERKLML